MAKRFDGISREVWVRPIRDAVERASWDDLMEAHRCPRLRSPFGAVLRHVAELLEGGSGRRCEVSRSSGNQRKPGIQPRRHRR